jgi:tetratricopeptide (TPR) repeat protein
LLLHFYVDSFIWKVRDRDVRKALDISGGMAPKEAPQWKGALHAGAYFGIPILLVAVIGARQRTTDHASDERWALHAAELFPSSGKAIMGRARVELAHDQLLEARASLERAFAVAPTLAGTASTLAELDQVEGVESVAHLRAATVAEPENARLHLAFAVALANHGLVADAEKELRRSAVLAPRRPEPHMQLGVLERSEGRFDEALAEFRVAGTLAPGGPQVDKEIAMTVAAQRSLPRR